MCVCVCVEVDDLDMNSFILSLFLSGVQMDHVSLLKQFEHLDPHNQNTFEAKDLELLIATVFKDTSQKTATHFIGENLLLLS